MSTLFSLASDAAAPSHVLSTPSPEKSLMKAPPRKTHTSENCAAMARAEAEAPDFVLNRDEEHPAKRRIVLLVQEGGSLHHARVAPLPQRLSVGEEDKEEDERHPDRPEQQEEISDGLDRIVLLGVVITAAHDLQVRVKEGAHIALGAIELVLGAIPGVEDPLGDRRAEHEGDEEPAATRAETADAAAVEDGNCAQRNGDEQQSGRNHAQEQSVAETERDALAGKERAEGYGHSREEQLAPRHDLELSNARHNPCHLTFHLSDRLTQPLAVTPGGADGQFKRRPSGAGKGGPLDDKGSE
eukprot:scaffold38239_cov66-Phaeocystis_antarctica.AAC.4